MFGVFRSLRAGIQDKLPKARTILQMRILTYVEEQKNSSMSDIARELGVAPPAVTILTDKLVSNGELARSTDKTDRRIIRLKVTPRGRAELANGMKALRATILERMSVLSETERAEFSTILKKLIKK